MTVVNENVRQLVAGIDASVRALAPTARWIDWSALAVAIVFLAVAVALAMLWTDAAAAHASHHYALRAMPRYIGG